MIKNIHLNKNDNGIFMNVQYVTDDGSEHTVIRVYDDEANEVVTKFVGGEIDEAALIDFVNSGRDDAERMMETVMNKVNKLSTHLRSDGNHVWFDNRTFNQAMLDTTLEDHLVRLISSGASDDEIIGWANFAERLYGNTDIDIREQLVRWLRAQDWLTVDRSGRLVGYRGCAHDAERDIPVSVHAGPAVVNGESMNGNIPNVPGTIVEMRRYDVQHDPTVGCASGLHVGTFSYACGWAPQDGYLIRVAVAPEDIVSVPFECDSNKIRCCKFEVLDARHMEDVKEELFRDNLTYFQELFGSVDDDDDDEDIATDTNDYDVCCDCDNCRNCGNCDCDVVD